MKKIKTFIAVAILMITAITTYAQVKEYYYGFITSCGLTIYKTSPINYTDGQLVAMMDAYEAQYCN